MFEVADTASKFSYFVSKLGPTMKFMCWTYYRSTDTPSQQGFAQDIYEGGPVGPVS